jgi:hypothetical protein
MNEIRFLVMRGVGIAPCSPLAIALSEDVHVEMLLLN